MDHIKQLIPFTVHFPRPSIVSDYLIISSTQEKLITHHHTSKEVDIKVVVQSILLLLQLQIQSRPFQNRTIGSLNKILAIVFRFPWFGTKWSPFSSKWNTIGKPNTVRKPNRGLPLEFWTCLVFQPPLYLYVVGNSNRKFLSFNFSCLSAF